MIHAIMTVVGNVSEYLSLVRETLARRLLECADNAVTIAAVACECSGVHASRSLPFLWLSGTANDQVIMVITLSGSLLFNRGTSGH